MADNIPQFRRKTSSGYQILQEGNPFQIPDNKIQENITVTPSNERQVLHATSPYNGVHEIIVKSVSESEAALKKENIRAGVTIFDITGEYGGGSAVLGTKTVDPSTTIKTYNASEDSLDGYSSFTVNAIQTETKSNINASATQNVIVNRSTGKFMTKVTINKVTATEGGVTKDITSDMIKSGVTILGINGTNSGGGSGNYKEIDAEAPRLHNYTLNTPDGYDAISRVNILGVQDLYPDLIASNIKAGKNIMGIVGNYNGTDLPFVPNGEITNLTVQPKTFEQNITTDGEYSGYSGFNPVKVLSVLDIEPNLKPENIVHGVEIFDIVGEAETGTGNYETVAITPKLNSQSITVSPHTPPYDAIERANVSGLLEIEQYLRPEYIRAGYTLFRDPDTGIGVTGTYTGGDNPFIPNGQLQKDICVNPSKEVQHVYPDTGYVGFEKFTVNSVTNADPNLIPENIKEGVTIFDITGTMPTGLDRDIYLQSKAVNPTIYVQNVRYDSSYDGLSNVMINSMTDAYPTFIAENIKAGVDIAGIVGTYLGDGEEPFVPDGTKVQLIKTANPSNEVQNIDPDEGYVAIKRVIVNSVSNADPNLRPGNIRKGVTIFGITGIVDPGEGGLYEIKSVNPSNEIQNILPSPDYDALSKVVVNSVTNSDPNLKPENIRAGITIFDITGTYTGDGEDPFVPTGQEVELLHTGHLYYENEDDPTKTYTSETPSSGYVAMKEVTIPTIKSIEPLLVPNNIRKGVTMFNGKLVGTAESAATSLRLQQKSVHPLATEEVVVMADESYDALSAVRVASIIDSEPALIPENIKKGVDILGIVGTYEGEGSTYSGNRDLYIGEHSDIATGDLYIDSTTLVPENIKYGVEIFGVTGNYSGGSLGPNDIFNNGRWFNEFKEIIYNYNHSSQEDSYGLNFGIDYSTNKFYISTWQNNIFNGYIKYSYVYPRNALSLPSGKSSIEIKVSQIYSGFKLHFFVLSGSESESTRPDESEQTIINSIGTYTYSVPSRYTSSNFTIFMYSEYISLSTHTNMITIDYIKFV